MFWTPCSFHSTTNSNKLPCYLWHTLHHDDITTPTTYISNICHNPGKGVDCTLACMWRFCTSVASLNVCSEDKNKPRLFRISVPVCRPFDISFYISWWLFIADVFFYQLIWLIMICAGLKIVTTISNLFWNTHLPRKVISEIVVSHCAIMLYMKQ